MLAKVLKAAFMVPLILITAGCSSSGVTGLTVKETINGQDDQYYFDKPMISGLSMAESNDGYYFFSGHNNSYLYYVDKTNMKTQILCNKPDCLHDKETDPSRSNACNAFFYNCNCNLMYYDQSLYLFSDNGTNLYRITLEGLNR